jgi:hypothetical protein
MGSAAIIIYILMVLHNRSLRILKPTEIESIAVIFAIYLVAVIVGVGWIAVWLSARAPGDHPLARFFERHRFFAMFTEVTLFGVVFFGGFIWIAMSIDSTGITDFSGGYLEAAFGSMGRVPDAEVPIRISWAPLMIIFGFIVSTVLFRGIRLSAALVKRILFEDERLTIAEVMRLGLTYLMIIVAYAVLFMAADGRLFTVTVFDAPSDQIKYWYGLALMGMGGPVDILDYFYFSLSTISTVGYGDIHPVSPLAKVLSMSEALMGTISFALIVGSVMKGIMGKKKEE